MKMVSSVFLNQYQKLVKHWSKIMTLATTSVVDDFKQSDHLYQLILDFNKKYFSLLNRATTLPYDATEYTMDYLQRSIIFWDVIRKRGNQYLEHLAQGQPPVLIFKYKTILDGRTFKRPVNYALVEIIPPANFKIDDAKRPYIIVDPRAGHGSGIGGFKDDSQVGVALRAGHPVYFVIFYPEPEPEQTLHDITAAEEKFLREVAKRHPKSLKPCVIGNCQGGWAVMALVAAHPDVAGVVVINGAPLSYWAGENGKNPMRYTGGMLGGSWLAQLSSDLGNGKFDGAHLVSNFETLNPANTYWKKYYNLFANIDTEEQNFLKFERWWGGFILMNASEMRSIVNNLFIGNKLAHGKIPLDKKSNIDFRNIRLPIIIFCSEADNITPPEQALHWITDIYKNDLELKFAGQVIIYLVHQNVGHLGIFVSGNVAKKEHRKILDLLDHVEHLPPGLYEMLIHDAPTSTPTDPHYSIELAERSINDIMSMSDHSKDDDEKLFNIVHAVSDLNISAYDLIVSPFIRPLTTDDSAKFLQETHNLRMSRYLFSDQNVWLKNLSFIAPTMRRKRISISKDNPFLALQQIYSEIIISMLDSYKEMRDTNVEILFHHIYGSLDALLSDDIPFRNESIRGALEPVDSELVQHIMSSIEDGGEPEAVIRILLLVFEANHFAGGHHISKAIKKLRNSELFKNITDNQFRSIIHAQTLIVEYDPEMALSTLPLLLDKTTSYEHIMPIITSVLAVLELELADKARARLSSISKMLQKFKKEKNPVRSSNSK